MNRSHIGGMGCDSEHVIHRGYGVNTSYTGGMGCYSEHVIHRGYGVLQ